MPTPTQEMESLVATAKQVMVANYRPAPIVLDHGKGATLFDKAGNRYIDLVAGVAVSGLGHDHPAVVAVLQGRLHQVLHTSNLYYNEPAIALAQRLTKLTFADRVFFCQSGTEANEAALKLARRFHYAAGSKRSEFVTALDSFHGRSMGALTATGQPKYHAGFEPLIPGFHYVPYGDLESLRQVVSDKTAAVMLEPVQGEGGVRLPPDGYLAAVRALCDERGALFILDEVQTGVGRTGTFLRSEALGVTPDIATLAKGLAAGLPLGAMLVREEVAKALVPGSHASTFGGNPLCCAVGGAVVDVVSQPAFLAQVVRQGERVAAHLDKLLTRCEVAFQARGVGLLRGLELKRELPGLVDRARQKGVLINIIGQKVIRVAPPLVITDAELDEGMERLTEALEAEVQAA